MINFKSLVVFTLFGIASAGATSPLQRDEEIIFFPTSAHLSTDGLNWVVPLHGWVFEPEKNSVWREAVLKGLLAIHPAKVDAAGEKLFRKRARMFLVDSGSGKLIHLRLGLQKFSPVRSGSDGHFQGEVRVGKETIGEKESGNWLSFEAVLSPGDEGKFAGSAQLLSPQGISVISDLDDTIKATGVLEQGERFANTFLREFRGVPGMAEAYRQWQKTGAAFHYVSGSPWQFYPFFQEFLDKQGFPRGSFHLRLFGFADKGLIEFFASPEGFKVAAIKEIIGAYPGRQFILVGDSTEKDPEVYGTIARRFPGQVKRIFIRDVSPQIDQSERWRTAFTGLPAALWTLFRDPSDLLKLQFSK